MGHPLNSLFQCCFSWETYYRSGWTLPLDVIAVMITYGGSNAPICHGAGLRHKTLSDLVIRYILYTVHYTECTLTKFFFTIPTVLSLSMPMVNSRKSTIKKNLLQFRVALALQGLSQLSPSRWTGAPMPSSSPRKTHPSSRWMMQYLVLEQIGKYCWTKKFHFAS